MGEGVRRTRWEQYVFLSLLFDFKKGRSYVECS